jgi:hypothetical protein
MDTKDINTKLSEIISSENNINTNQEEINENQVNIKVVDGLFEHTEFINKKYVTNDGRQLLKEIKFEQ